MSIISLLSRSVSASIRKKNVILIIFLVLASAHFVKTTFQILNSKHRLEDIQDEVSNLEDYKVRLEKEIEYKNSQNYVEEEARNSLNMIKPGEKVFVVPGDEYDNSELEERNSTEVLGEHTPLTGFKSTNIYMWYRLFF